jgi:hypothetical protein
MSEFGITLYEILGLILRLGIPILLTLLMAWGIRKLDARWQAEAKEFQETLIERKKKGTLVPCWETMNCPPSIREKCPAYGVSSIPCWEVKSNGNLPAACQACVYRRILLSETHALA